MAIICSAISVLFAAAFAVNLAFLKKNEVSLVVCIKEPQIYLH